MSNKKSVHKEINFPGKHDSEEIILFLHRHWFIFLMRFLAILAALFSVAAIHFAFLFLVEDFQSTYYYNMLVFGEGVATLFIWNFFFVLFIDYYLDVWIVTNERIINIEQRGFFYRNISELKLEKIQDVTSEIIGVIPTLLNYGNIYVQTAGETGRFMFQQIPNPNQVKNVIVELQEKEKKSKQEH